MQAGPPSRGSRAVWVVSSLKLLPQNLSHWHLDTSRWDRNFSHPTFFEAGGIGFFWGSHDKLYEFGVHTTGTYSLQRSALAYESILHDCSAVYAVTRSHLAYASASESETAAAAAVDFFGEAVLTMELLDNNASHATPLF